MNAKDILLKEHAEALKENKQTFVRHMALSTVIYDNIMSACSTIMEIIYDGDLFEEMPKEYHRDFLKEKCKALIEMDKRQILIAQDFKDSKHRIETQFQKAWQATETSTSVWFSGDPTERTFN